MFFHPGITSFPQLYYIIDMSGVNIAFFRCLKRENMRFFCLHFDLMFDIIPLLVKLTMINQKSWQKEIISWRKTSTRNITRLLLPAVPVEILLKPDPLRKNCESIRVPIVILSILVSRNLWLQLDVLTSSTSVTASRIQTTNNKKRACIYGFFYSRFV